MKLLSSNLTERVTPSQKQGFFSPVCRSLLGALYVCEFPASLHTAIREFIQRANIQTFPLGDEKCKLGAVSPHLDFRPKRRGDA